MSASAARPVSEELELTAGHRLRIDHQASGDIVHLLSGSGDVKLAIHITDDGPVLRFEDSGFTIQAAGDLRIAANRVAIHGEEGVAFSTGGDLDLTADGAVNSRSRQHNIEAELGNVNVRANDDVIIDGERIRMNC